MSVLVLNNKSVPQPWMSYKCSVVSDLKCCSALITETESLLPFQIISSGPFESFELSPYGENDWTVTPITVTTVISEGLYIISYAGTALDIPLACGTYDARLTAGDVWYFEPITVKDFTITTNDFTKVDDLMLPLKFTEQVNSGMRVIAPCDSFLPWMYSTVNPTTSPFYYLVDQSGMETLLTITVDVMTISGRTYYIHDGACFYPFLTCGDYYLKIVDGAYTYYSVWFRAECSMNDIPDGYRASLDFDRHVTYDEDCAIIYEDCSDIVIEITKDPLAAYTLISGTGYFSSGQIVHCIFTLTGLSTTPANVHTDFLVNGVSYNEDEFTLIYNGVIYEGDINVSGFMTPIHGATITIVLGGES